LDTTLYQEIEIPRPGSDYQSEPSVGDPYVESSFAYLPIHWRNTALQYACQIWKIDDSTNQAELAYSFPLSSGPCSGIWTMAGEQYMFVGSSLMKFAGMQAPPVLVKDLGKATATPWMAQVGDKLFFQTRTPVESNSRIDLWVTDGTEAGTKAVKELETAFFAFNVFSPTSFQGKLYFAHRKSLWSSDGTEAGTSIVATIPTSSVVGDGAIGTISVVDGRLHFLATSDASGREPWVSDGTGAGTMLLRDIREGATGSATASTNRTYFHAWNGQALFSADDGVVGSALWSTDGTLGGTKLVATRPITTIAGFLGSKMLLHDGHFFYAMSLP
jgi:ELWxxDGT repeat protein